MKTETQVAIWSMSLDEVQQRLAWASQQGVSRVLDSDEFDTLLDQYGKLSGWPRCDAAVNKYRCANTAGHPDQHVNPFYMEKLQASPKAEKHVAKFEKFHAANPHVYDELVRLARLAKSSGREVSFKKIYNDVRWAEDRAKLSDAFAGLYVRLIMQQEQDLTGFFPLREVL